MEELEVSFAGNGEKAMKSNRSVLSRIRFETINLELFICTVLAGIFESSAEGQLSLTFHGVLFFMLSVFANILLIELVFRFMKVVKNGKVGKFGRNS